MSKDWGLWHNRFGAWLRIADLIGQQELVYSSFAVYNTLEDAELVVQIYGLTDEVTVKPFE